MSDGAEARARGPVAAALPWVVAALAALVAAALVSWRGWTDIAGAKEVPGLDGRATWMLVVHGALALAAGWTWLRTRGHGAAAATAGAAVLLVDPALAHAATWGPQLALGWLVAAVCVADGLCFVRIGRPARAVGAVACLGMAAWIAGDVFAGSARAHVPAGELVGMLVPRRVGGGPYLGAVALLCAVAAVVLPGARGRRTWLAGGVFVAGVALAVAHHVAWLGVARVALALLVASGITGLVALEDERWRRAVGRALVGLGVAVGFTLALLFVLDKTPMGKAAPARDAWAWALAAWVPSVWAVQRTVSAVGGARRVFAGVAAVILALDLWVAVHPAQEAAWRPPPPKAAKAQSGK